jgi:5-methylcytosine-specific restriction endonuclease McrA
MLRKLRFLMTANTKKALGWEDVTIDHVLAWIKGGQTALKNAQVLCKHCNSKKGGR